ncbi:hypothetical protein C7999DRAFT_38993 [Corynascus novoguineensis]|uniref:SET domain-containing protein n=1 Tax=Corynascus novoguineensis TaxID=1126955 RepID=A0AAN7HSG0_9PEZI|nr:hypothetical protein C7999DRAFT_38993 [Corynascus novoguineensis]
MLRRSKGNQSLLTKPNFIRRLDGTIGTALIQEICPLANDWSIWSYKPFCIGPAEGEDETGPADCVFTLTAFRGNQGISLITTPDLAASAATHLDDSRVPRELRHQLVDTKHQEVEGTAYEIKDLPGRGKGAIAKRKFAEHEIVMVGYPVLVIRLDFLNGDRLTEREKRVMLETSVRQLPPEQKRSVMSLARSTGGEPILDAIRTNGFGIEIDGIQHLAVFLDGSRVNHNCRPNSFWRYISSSMAMEVVALRDIRPGEEIVHSYAPLGYTYEERKAVLQAWGFQCRCALCSASIEERNLSDRRRERLLEIHHILGQADLLGSKRVGALIIEAMGLIDQEELHPQLVEYYQQFAKAYMALSDLKRARAFVTETDKMWSLYGGEEHENLDGMRDLWRALEEAEGEAEEVEDF